MRKTLVLLGILTFLISLKAQETNYSQSRVEQFMKAQDKIIAGYSLYSCFPHFFGTPSKTLVK
jgi:hypothetical protein